MSAFQAYKFLKIDCPVFLNHKGHKEKEEGFKKAN
jgi:hypothetical protein